MPEGSDSFDRPRVTGADREDAGHGNDRTDPTARTVRDEHELEATRWICPTRDAVDGEDRTS